MIHVHMKLHSIVKEPKIVYHSNVIVIAWPTNISAYENLPLRVFSTGHWTRKKYSSSNEIWNLLQNMYLLPALSEK